jgi:hypothetical protein
VLVCIAGAGPPLIIEDKQINVPFQPGESHMAVGNFSSNTPRVPAVIASATAPGPGSNGVHGITSSDADSAVYGEHTAAGIGVFGRGGPHGGQGVFGQHKPALSKMAEMLRRFDVATANTITYTVLWRNCHKKFELGHGIGHCSPPPPFILAPMGAWADRLGRDIQETTRMAVGVWK